VIVKGLYGTELFPPHTECDKEGCDTRAVGVLIKDKIAYGQRYQEGQPLCIEHRDYVRDSLPNLWKSTEFMRFIDA